MTAIDSVTAEHVSDGVPSPAEPLARRLRRRTGFSALPATRDLQLTLWALVAAAGVAITAGAVFGAHPLADVAFALAAVTLIGAFAIVRAVTTLTPHALRPDSARRRVPIRVAVVGTAAAARDLRAGLHASDVASVEVVGAIAPTGATGDDAIVLGGLDDARTAVEGHAIDMLLVAPGVSRGHVVDVAIRTCEGHPVRVYDMAEFYEDVFGHVPIVDVDNAWLEHLLHPRFRDRPSQRLVDLVVGGLLGLVCLPVVGLAAILIRRDGGPALFRQVRIGRDGRPFVLYKLRTMRLGEVTTGWTADEDPRITSLGRWLRKLHVDELPQLVNVLRGEMTLVGPRPEQPDIVAGLEAELPLWRGRHRYKPGLTGWAQVRCGYAGSHDGSARKLAHDLYYLRHHSLALDVAIVVQTARLLVARRTPLPAPMPFLDRMREPETGPTLAPRTSVRMVPRIVPPRALVTGGAGFIGSHLVDALVESGVEVVVVDDLSSGRPENLAGALSADVRLETGDVTDADAMLRLFSAVRPRTVFHLAAQIEVMRAVDDPLHDARANVVGTLAVLEAARACGTRRFVLASSGGAVYGDATIIPTPEHAALAPLSPYGAAKLAAEQYAALYGRLFGMSTVALRLANVYGPRQGGSGEGGVVARFCHARANGAPAQVFGDGRQTRDYVHVRDVVAAFAAAGRGNATGVLNVGTRTETSVLDLVRELGLIADFRPARPGEVARSCLDAMAARQALGWMPGVPFAEGVAETLESMGAIPDERTLRAI
jgi:UDP-glucose 4-epimerase